MYEIVKTLDEKHVTPTREMTLILARCCHCGVVQKVLEQNVRRANRSGRKHCALCREETFHRMTGTRFWSIWRHMVARATDPNSPDFARYGAAGRGVCSEWLDFKKFYNDMFDGYRDDLTIERIDNSKGYSKENCRWATNMEQQSNKNNNRVIHFQGRDMHLAEFCRVTGTNRVPISTRLNRGMSPEEALVDYATSTYPKNRKSRKSTISSIADLV
jgi:hypothetical protein